MDIVSAIHEEYGIKISAPPPDGVWRRFRIDRFRIGIAVSIGDVGVFGCKYEGFMHVCSANGIERIDTGMKVSKTLAFEALIVDCAKGLVERGERLSPEDEDRLSLALQRLSEF